MAQPIHVSAAGARAALVTVEARGTSSPGFPVETWVPLVTTWMQKVDVIGTEALRADQVSARYEVRFIAPYAPALDPERVDVPATHRLVHRGRQYDIVGAAIVGTFEGIDYKAMTHTGA
jgi:hypothetical protein